MGSKISIDKYVSRLEDILQLNIKHIEKVKLEVDIPENITQNIKVMRTPCRSFILVITRYSYPFLSLPPAALALP